ncbi:hypothetical protein X907_0175 [Glycocaulis alkaliphilus]|uniref:Uncharacterized protein n=2 Tax=Glycocaulis alkaliphilus TaxID=1434191 RepID=A0A3T0E5S5_9PROT|nr:hypothetical protein X907_0175 [Glycocaulis alkaliphilus]GGB79489.1 hypothetical protein GCM10007417_19220 [Glycocaulis alkaliphilus]
MCLSRKLDPEMKSLNAQTAEPKVMFDRRELDTILRVYGMMVAAGEWRDYAIDGLKDRAEFSVFRHAAEFPLYRIVKTPADARKQGAWKIVSATGVILKRGHELHLVLKVFDKARLRLA